MVVRTSMIVVSLAAMAACGGAEGNRAARPANGAMVEVKAEPVEFEVAGKRVGSAVLLEIVGVGRGVAEGQAFEDPTNWSIRCSAAGQTLQRVVNGSARVERAPVGPAHTNRWDVTVEFSVGFALPADVSAVDVGVSAPGARSFTGPVSLEFAMATGSMR